MVQAGERWESAGRCRVCQTDTRRSADHWTRRRAVDKRKRWSMRGRRQNKWLATCAGGRRPSGLQSCHDEAAIKAGVAHQHNARPRCIPDRRHGGQRWCLQRSGKSGLLWRPGNVVEGGSTRAEVEESTIPATIKQTLCCIPRWRPSNTLVPQPSPGAMGGRFGLLAMHYAARSNAR